MCVSPFCTLAAEPCVQFLRRQADRLGLAVRVHAAGGDPAKPVVIITWPGAEPGLKSILLNSHMDVVPVYRESWTHDPFAADIDAHGRIFARGAQDTKCIGVQYLAAIRALQRQQFRPRRTIHVVFVPGKWRAMCVWIYCHVWVGCAIPGGARKTITDAMARGWICY